jgi:hypothetical protein
MTTEYIYTYRYTREGATYTCIKVSRRPPSESETVLRNIRTYFYGAILISVKKYRDCDARGITTHKYTDTDNVRDALIHIDHRKGIQFLPH